MNRTDISRVCARGKNWFGITKAKMQTVLLPALFCFALMPGLAFAQDTKIDNLVGTGGRWRRAIDAIGQFFFWALIVLGSILVGRGIYELIQEFRKQQGQPREWRRPVALLIGGSALTVTIVILRILTRTVTGENIEDPTIPWAVPTSPTSTS